MGKVGFVADVDVDGGRLWLSLTTSERDLGVIEYEEVGRGIGE